MAHEVQVGTILIRENPVMAQAIGLQSEPYSAPWDWSQPSMGWLWIARSMPQDGTFSSWRQK